MNSRYEVVIRVTDPATGAALVRKAHECSGLAEARTLLTNLREMAEELSAYLPGLSVEGYEREEAPAALAGKPHSGRRRRLAPHGGTAMKEAEYMIELDRLPRLSTLALLRTLKAWQEAEATEKNGERHYSLLCLIESAEEELEGRRDSYTGEYDS